MELNIANVENLINRKPINFDSISKLTKEGLVILFQTPKVLLKFINVKEIDNDLLSLFLTYNGYSAIILDGLETINDDQAIILGKINQSLSLNGIKSLSLSCATSLISRNKGTDNTLYMDGITEVSNEVFEELTKTKTPLSLNGLLEINEQMAKCLVKNHKDYVSLNGVKNISDKVASILAKFKGFLYLNGIKHLSEDAINSFVKFQGRSLDFSKEFKSIFNKSIYTVVDKNNDLQLFLSRINSSEDWVYVYVVGYSGSRTFSENFYKYKKVNSDYLIFKKSAIPDETWDSFFKNDIIIYDQNLKLSIEDQKYVSILMQFVKKEYLIYNDEIFLNDECKKLLKKNVFASPYWDDGGSKIYQILSKSWDISYKW
jgi:hypothetical protein